MYSKKKLYISKSKYHKEYENFKCNILLNLYSKPQILDLLSQDIECKYKSQYFYTAAVDPSALFLPLVEPHVFQSGNILLWQPSYFAPQAAGFSHAHNGHGSSQLGRN